MKTHTSCVDYDTFSILLQSGWAADLEFLETWKSQGIQWHLKKVREMSGNFNAKLEKVREFYLREMNIVEVFFFKIHASGEQKLVMTVHRLRINLI